MSAAEQALQDLEAAYRAHLASGNGHVASYSIAGRSRSSDTRADLLKALHAARCDVAADRAAQRTRLGLPERQQFVIRM